MIAAVLLGSGHGPVALLAAAGALLREQLRRRDVALVVPDEVRREGGDLAGAVGGASTVLAAVECVPPWRAVEAIASVAALTPTGRVDVRLVTERQDRLAEHLLMAGVRAGKPIADVDEFEHDHAQSVRTLHELPFVASVDVQPYELVHADTSTWIDDALGLVGLQGRLDLRPLVADGTVLAPYRDCSPLGVELGQALLPEVTTAAERRLLHDFLVESFPSGERDRPLDGATGAGIVARHRTANRAFFAEFLPDLPADSYDDDAATARLADLPTAVRVPGPSPATRARKRAGRVKRAVLRRLPRDD